MNDKPDYWSAIAADRSVPRRRSNHAQGSTVRDLEILAIPRVQANAIRLQAFRTVHRGEHSSRLPQQLPTTAVQIVEVMIVAQQDVVDLADVFSRDGGPNKDPEAQQQLSDHRCM